MSSATFRPRVDVVEGARQHRQYAGCMVTTVVLAVCDIHEGELS